MRTIPLSLLGIALLFTACSKDKNENVNPGTNINTPAGDIAYVSTVASTSDSVVFKYNSDMTLQHVLSLQLSANDNTILNGMSWFPHYESGLPAAFYVTTNWQSGNTGTPGNTFIYNSAKQLVKVVYSPDNLDSLVYNSKGQLTTIHYLSSSEENYRTTITYENNNPVKRKDTNIDAGRETSDSLVITYKYDNKKSAYQGVHLVPVLQEDLYFYLAENNPVERKIVAYNNGAVQSTKQYTFDYVYNAQNYPVSYTRTQSGDVVPGTEQFRITYLQQ
ncbi:MAG TPA: hypothetical protein VFS25_14820 [Chitinophaga sp.]|uniref:hypothetical protein n=1 Tax=Chitinophaga sp. TaxID=1869181 RepID=UPI002DBDFD5A|nr:hypothetical protein [Chitinophaga sp.]HEU4554114.1 hypothetical protein [Chitinophaga sp.]